MKRTTLPHTLGWYKKDLWKIFSLFIRTRDKFTCFTCGKSGDGKGMHAGHFIPRSTGGLSLYFHEMNVHAQCYFCNINLGGNGAEYYRRMIEKYGNDDVAELFRLRDTGYKKYSIEEYKEMKELYKDKIEELNG